MCDIGGRRLILLEEAGMIHTFNSDLEAGWHTFNLGHTLCWRHVTGDRLWVLSLKLHSVWQSVDSLWSARFSSLSFSTTSVCMHPCFLPRWWEWLLSWCCFTAVKNLRQGAYLATTWQEVAIKSMAEPGRWRERHPEMSREWLESVNFFLVLHTGKHSLAWCLAKMEAQMAVSQPF